MHIHCTKMGCLSRQAHKSQSEISKSIEGNHSQENYHSTTVPFGCQPNIPNVKKNAIHINCPRANDAKWKTLDEELSFILRTSLKGSIDVKLHSFTNIVHAMCLEHFGSEDQQNHKRTANRRQQLLIIKGKNPCISQVENVRKQRLKQRNARRTFDKNPFKFTKKFEEGKKKMEFLMYKRNFGSVPTKKIFQFASWYSYGWFQWTQ